MKHDFYFIKKKIKEIGLELLTTEEEFNVSNRKLVTLTAKCQKHNHETSFSVKHFNVNIMNGKTCCKYCGREKIANKLRLKKSIDEIKNEFNNRGFELLEDGYINSVTKMKYRCLKHYNEEQSISWANFKSGKGCIYCARETVGKKKRIKVDIEYIRKQFILYGMQLLEKEYIHTNMKMKFRCAKHHNIEQYISWKEFTYDNQRCKYCSYDKARERERKPYEEVKKMFENEGYILLTPKEEYINSKHKVKYICPNHSEYIAEMSPGQFVAGQRCPRCSTSIGENVIENILKENNYSYKKQLTIKGCKDKKLLRFDFAVFNHNKLYCLIEYNGIQHYKPVNAFGGHDAHFDTRKKDIIKENYCKQKNIPLIVIPYTEKNIEEYLISRLKEMDKSIQLNLISYNQA